MSAASDPGDTILCLGIIRRDATAKGRRMQRPWVRRHSLFGWKQLLVESDGSSRRRGDLNQAPLRALHHRRASFAAVMNLPLDSPMAAPGARCGAAEADRPRLAAAGDG
jgi:hypothetical protein